jgi:short-subunit dehydrogenase
MGSTGKYALITGASSGIGAAFARRAAQSGLDLGLSARRKDRLDELAAELRAQFGVQVDVLCADLCQSHAGAGLLEQVMAAGRQVDVLVNNAGYSIPAGFAQTSLEQQELFLQLSIQTPVALAHGVLPHMLETGWGRILNISSITALSSGGKGHTLYPAGKAFLLKFSQSLHAEVSGRGVHVSAVMPGFVATEFQQANGMEDEINAPPAFMTQTPAELVREAWARNDKGVELIYPGWAAKTMAAAFSILPEKLARVLTRPMAARAYVGD